MISQDTITYIKNKYANLIIYINADYNSYINYPVIYVIEKLVKINPIAYSGSNFRNTHTYMGSSKKLKKDIQILGNENFKKHIIFVFSKDITKKELRKIESSIQKIEGHKNSVFWYNETDIAGPGMTKGMYTGENRTIKMKESHEKQKHLIGDNRTVAQKARDVKMATYKGDKRTIAQRKRDIKIKEYKGRNRTERQKECDILKSIYVGENRTERQKEGDILKSIYVGEKRTDAQKIRDQKMVTYTGKNRTDAQKLHDAQMKLFKGKNRTEAQKLHDAQMKLFKGKNRTEAQKINDINNTNINCKYVSLINDNGENIQAKSIRLLCRTYHLYRPAIIALTKGRIKKYKGWAIHN